ncbi:MAG: tRNA uridine(34) 5-carboxymethylaminomethyl modification radical SAM/GNAT enzyme Elp3 [Patescibacteria group bacterium]|jgi:elongator complex protein 3
MPLPQLIKSLSRQTFPDRLAFDQARRRLCRELKLPAPASTELLKVYNKLVKSKEIKPNPALQNWLKKREVRTLSGVAPIAVLTKPYPCPGRCAYCPTEKGMPKSYLSNEPAVMRAILTKFDPAVQVKTRLDALTENGHNTDKCELIVMGGTWSYLPKNYQNWYIKRCFDAFNGRRAKNLKVAQNWNEKAHHRVVGLTLETRPDFITPEEINRWRQLGATRVELGVQHLDDKILKLNLRGHDSAETARATKLLKQAGFKITYHLMPGLPGSTPQKDLAVFKKLFSDPDFQPDQIKIYPCVVVKGSLLYRWWKAGKYKPYTDKQLYNLLVKIKNLLPPYTRLTRLIRDIPRESIEAGNKISNLRQMLAADKRVKCRCIRCREVKNQESLLRRGYGGQARIKNQELKSRHYPASGGVEYFLSFEDKKTDKLAAFLRLRIPTKGEVNFIPELQNAALIREVHTYGAAMRLGGKSTATQHLGLGKKLILAAEKIAEKQGFHKIAVIAGIGVRPYYYKLGYKPEGTYLVKNLK